MPNGFMPRMLEMSAYQQMNSNLITLNAIHRQAHLGRMYDQAGVVRMALYHYRKVVELYANAPADVKKATETAFRESESRLTDLEAELPVTTPEPPKPRGEVVLILLWLYKYKISSKLRGYGEIR